MGIHGTRLLDVRHLTTAFTTESSTVKVVDDVGFVLDKGEILGLVGESGSGKTMTSLSIMRLVPPPGSIMGGEVLFEDRNLLLLSGRDMNRIRGNRIGMIFQEPMSALNPVLRVGDQICETIETHREFTKSEIRGQAVELLKRTGFNAPERTFMQYPHQLSGGQRQRILIAMAISCNPSLLIADEPSTALDVATESQILCLLKSLVSGNGMSMIFITHNLHIIRSLAHTIGIMYAGRMLERNLVGDFFEKPLHPYSRGLLDSIVLLKTDQKRLKAIPGFVPKMSELPTGCTFHPRCAHVMDICRAEEPQITQQENGAWVRCWLYRN